MPIWIVREYKEEDSSVTENANIYDNKEDAETYTRHSDNDCYIEQRDEY